MRTRAFERVAVLGLLFGALTATGGEVGRSVPPLRTEVLKVVRKLDWPGGRETGQFIFRSRDEFARVWQEDAKDAKSLVPEVDFDREMVIAVFPATRVIEAAVLNPRIKDLSKVEPGDWPKADNVDESVIVFWGDRKAESQGQEKTGACVWVLPSKGATNRFVDLGTVEGKSEFERLQKRLKLERDRDENLGKMIREMRALEQGPAKKDDGGNEKAKAAIKDLYENYQKEKDAGKQ